eukprot:COSAG05_NODE_14725_length_389_cov_0.741379_1_plen_71_part_01
MRKPNRRPLPFPTRNQGRRRPNAVVHGPHVESAERLRPRCRQSDAVGAEHWQRELAVGQRDMGVLGYSMRN